MRKSMIAIAIAIFLSGCVYAPTVLVNSEVIVSSVK